MNVVRTIDLRRSYRMGENVVHALAGVSLSIERGELIAIMGPSGSGKTTLMNVIGCLDSPTGGRVVVNGEDVSDMSESELAVMRNRTIGFVFQSFSLLPRMNVLENVVVPLEYAGIAPAERRRRAAEILQRVGLDDRLRHKPSELSGGQRQRAAIARALVNNPTILLADEPTGSLDSHTGSMIMELVLEIHRSGRTVIIVTHDPEVAAYCPRTIEIRDGRIGDDR